jgi:LAO/AO transport system kinase
MISKGKSNRKSNRNNDAVKVAGGWAGRLTSGDRRSIATAITAVENDTPAAREVLHHISHLTGNAMVVGFTGAPGVGKSTLVSACIRALRRQKLSVGVVAVDPSSVFSGGAMLGDRVRMQEHSGDEEVFIRSVASRGQLGGLSRSTAQVVDVLDAAGKDIILIETVGTGQSEIEIAKVAQVKVVVVQPGAGDSVQAMKAGVLEIADILVVNKSDHPTANQCENYLRQIISLRSDPARHAPIIQTTALSEEGVSELVETIFSCHQSINVGKEHEEQRA